MSSGSAGKGGKVNGLPGFFRLWMGRIFWGLVVTVPLSGLVLVLLMIVAELRGLDRAKTGLAVANSLLTSAMNDGKPEAVPMAIRRLGAATGTTIMLFREDGTPAFSNRLTLDRLKAFTPIPESWVQAPHTPDQFLWPPSTFPPSLTHEVDRIFARKQAPLLTDQNGRASPLALRGGYAVWAQSIPNRTTCARCHGFDQEVLGHWVAVTQVMPFASVGGTSLWGFWPLPGINQQILFLGTAGLVLCSLFLVSIFETWTLRRGMRPKKGKAKPSLQKKKGDGEEPPDLDIPQEGKEALHMRLKTLDESILALTEEIPRGGVQAQKKTEGKDLPKKSKLSDLLAEWSDRFELDLQEIAETPELKSNRVVIRFLKKAQELRSQAVSFADMAASGGEDKSLGILNAPFFETLSEELKDWTDRLRAVLGLLHTEVRAIDGIIEGSLAETEGPPGALEGGPKKPLTQKPQAP